MSDATAAAAGAVPEKDPVLHRILRLTDPDGLVIALFSPI